MVSLIVATKLAQIGYTDDSPYWYYQGGELTRGDLNIEEGLILAPTQQQAGSYLRSLGREIDLTILSPGYSTPCPVTFRTIHHPTYEHAMEAELNRLCDLVIEDASSSS